MLQKSTKLNQFYHSSLLLSSTLTFHFLQIVEEIFQRINIVTKNRKEKKRSRCLGGIQIKRITLCSIKEESSARRTRYTVSLKALKTKNLTIKFDLLASARKREKESRRKNAVEVRKVQGKKSIRIMYIYT